MAPKKTKILNYHQIGEGFEPQQIPPPKKKSMPSILSTGCRVSPWMAPILFPAQAGIASHRRGT